MNSYDFTISFTNMLINTSSSIICDYVCAIIKYLSRKKSRLITQKPLSSSQSLMTTNDDKATNDELNVINAN